MQTCKLSDIVIPSYRMRRVFDQTALQELANSIASPAGLIQAPVLREEDGKLVLIAGERRLRALQMLFSEGKGFSYDIAYFPAEHGVIPYVYKKDLSPEDALRVEMEENTIRVNLSWDEVASARAYIHSLRVKEGALRGEEVSIKSTIQHITGGPDSNSVRASLFISSHLDDPDVKKAKSLKEALKIVEKKQRSILLEELSTRLGGSLQSQHILHHGDSLDYMHGMMADSVDIILTDPPYGIDMHTMNPQSGSEAGTRHDYVDTEEYALDCISTLATEGFRICKPNAHCFMFCDIKMWPHWSACFTAAGWYVWPVPLIWNKQGTGSLLGTANGPRHCYEAVLFAQKGQKKCQVFPDVLDAPAGDASLHPANKSHEILTTLLSFSAVPGDTIADFFCGSGGIFAAADEYNCRVIACEKDNAHYATAFNALHKGDLR